MWLNNNATSVPDDNVLKTFDKYSRMTLSHTKYQEFITKSYEVIKRVINCTNYKIIYTSGASESNAMILRSATSAYFIKNQSIPHIIISSIEHKSIIDTAEHLQIEGVEVTMIEPNASGFICPLKVEAAIRKNTCLISIMHANNELGTINNIVDIGYFAKKYKVPFHTDVVQSVKYGYFTDPAIMNVDAVTIGFHKMHGLPGLGVLLLHDDLNSKHGYKAEIGGTQNYGLRGGTYSIGLIMANILAINLMFKNREEKNLHLMTLKECFIKEIETELSIIDYTNLVRSSPKGGLTMITTNSMLILGASRAMLNRQRQIASKKSLAQLIIESDALTKPDTPPTMITSADNDFRKKLTQIDQLGEILVNIPKGDNSDADKDTDKVVVRRGKVDKVVYKKADKPVAVAPAKYINTTIEIKKLDKSILPVVTSLPNTLLVSFIGSPLCNMQLRDILEEQDYHVSIGSFCNTDSQQASHVISALNISTWIKRGVIRLSFSDNNTIEEVKKFAQAVLKHVR